MRRLSEICMDIFRPMSVIPALPELVSMVSQLLLSVLAKPCETQPCTWTFRSKSLNSCACNASCPEQRIIRINLNVRSIVLTSSTDSGTLLRQPGLHVGELKFRIRVRGLGNDWADSRAKKIKPRNYISNQG